MATQWIYKPQTNIASVKHLMQVLNIEEGLASLLVQRGIQTFEEAKTWFRPSLSDLHDPFLMKDMQKAVSRLISAVQNKERILIYGDYDVDGTTAVSMFYLFLKSQNAIIEYYIPDRYKEGYGVSMAGIEYAKNNSFTLIVTLDCGIKANKQIDYANQNKIDVIVCDHHNEGDVRPDAYALLNPKQSDCPYPFKELSGCGVGFKLLQAYCISTGIALDNIYQYLDIVSVSIASDIVSMTGENRVLAFYGLQKIIDNPTIGIQAIKNTAQLQDKNVSVSDIVFRIGPRINAAGRIESGSLAVELLICDDLGKATDIVANVNRCNEDRKELDKAMTTEALAMLSADDNHASKVTNVVYSPDWHKGVVGIVASRITEVFYRPTIVLTYANGRITGSARSVDGFNLYAALEQCADLLENFGGHMYAAGLSMKEEHFDAFKERFEAVVRATIHPEMLIPKISIDAVLPLDSITPKFYRILKQFEPFGPGNMTPVFVSKSVYDYGSSRTIGSDGSHLKLIVHHPDSKNTIDAVGFGLGHKVDEVQNSCIDVCYTLDENSFRGTTSLQMMVRDIKKNND